jgi:hypothetical protein
MSNDPITTRLLREAERATLRMDDDLEAVLREAAAEIERLRDRCDKAECFIRNRAADNLLLKGGYHARRICLEAEKFLKDMVEEK